MTLTPRQHTALDFIRAYIADHGYSPTLREIGKHMGISSVVAFQHVKALVRKGEIIKVRGNRNLVLASDPVEEIIRAGEIIRRTGQALSRAETSAWDDAVAKYRGIA